MPCGYDDFLTTLLSFIPGVGFPGGWGNPVLERRIRVGDGTDDPGIGPAGAVFIPSGNGEQAIRLKPGIPISMFAFDGFSLLSIQRLPFLERIHVSGLEK
ncbi:hypothetical protein HMPREF9374_1653 [Desmospora sp. 8437]|nr:hypothetical protein HMPREF9374_1653 [Desmospora sp. 8437]